MALSKITNSGIGAIDTLTVDTDTLVVDSTNNNVGIGTTSPDVVNHIVGVDGKTTLASHDAQTVAVVENNADAQFAIVANSSNSSQLFFGDENSELVGRIRYEHSNNDMRFYTNSSEAMRIDGSGTVSFGGISGRATSSTGHLSISEQSDNRSYIELGTTTTVNRGMVAFLNSNGVVGSITVSGSSTSYNTSSDYRLKENVIGITGATERLKQLNPVRFNFIADADTTVDGFLAHEVQSVVPEAISGTHDEVDDDGNPVYQGIDQSKLVPLLVKTIQELEARIAALETA